MRAAVLVIDVQKDFFTHELLVKQRGAFVNYINDLVRIARAKKYPVVWVRTEFRQDMTDAFRHFRKQGTPICVAGSDGAKLLEELAAEPSDAVLVKKRYSAFFQTELDHMLKNWSVTHLILAGIYTHACVRTTAIDAYQRDYDVILARDCVASNDLEHHNDTWRYMDGKIVTGMSNKEIKSFSKEEMI